VIDNTWPRRRWRVRLMGRRHRGEFGDEVHWRTRHDDWRHHCDAGKFDWAASPRFKKDFVDPDPSYHGISYTAAFETWRSS